jgi:hypothetical protein
LFEQAALKCIWLESMFGSVIVGAFQIIFRAKIHANDVFSFFKNHFWHQHIKTIQNVQTILNFSKKKYFKFFRNAGWIAFPNVCMIFLIKIIFFLILYINILKSSKKIYKKIINLICVHISLRVPRLISEILKSMTM